MGLISDEFGPGVQKRRRRRTTIKYYSIGPSNNQVITLLVLAAAGGAAAMYFVPQLPNYISGLFKGTETPSSVIQKVKTDINNRKSSPVSKPTVKQPVVKQQPITGIRATGTVVANKPVRANSHYTYPTYRY